MTITGNKLFTPALKLWLLLWFFVDFILYFRNAVVNNTPFNLGGLLVVAFISLFPAFIAFLAWFLVRPIFKTILKKEIQPKHAFILWLVVFGFIFLFPLFK